MRARTVGGSDTDLGQDKLDGLKARLRGPLLKSGDAGYEDSRTVWNGMIDRRPALVALVRPAPPAPWIPKEMHLKPIVAILACFSGNPDAGTRFAADHSAVGNSDAWRDLKEFSTGGNCVTFQTEDEGPDRIAAAMGSSFHRLAAVKAAWDPENFFRTNRNIQPAMTAQKA